VRVLQQHGIRPTKNGVRANNTRDQDLHLSGCYLTIDFGRNSAPITASRNSVSIDDELQREIEHLVRSEVAALLPKLITTAQATCVTDSERHDAGYRALEDLLFLAAQRYGDRRAAFHDDSGLTEAAAAAYRTYCPMPIRSSDGKVRYQLLDDVDPNECNVAVIESLTTHAIFPPFVRAASLRSWIVVGDKRAMSLLEQTWPHTVPLRLLDEAAQLYEDFQSVLPEIREGHLWKMLRADYALCEGAVFGSVLSLPLPGRRGAVPRELGLAQRRFETSSTERPRIILNRNHQLVVALEEFLSRADDDAKQLVQLWLDRFCKDIIEEKSKRAKGVLLPRLWDELTQLTELRLPRLSLADLGV
jgi:hypothetical protein